MPRAGALTLGLKRAIDVIGAAAGLCLASPVLLGVGIASAATMGRPVFFTQPRGGQGGRVFAMYKFRTMRAATTDADGRPLGDNDRITPLGRWLRATSLDELPELWNVLRGDMSLVGPRPLIARYLGRYSPQQARRHDVRPGLTGWAQINGRNALTWDEKFALDLWYVDHQSLALDLQILLRTVAAVLGKRGIANSGDDTMPEFMGGETNGGATPATSAPATETYANPASPPQTRSSGDE